MSKRPHPTEPQQFRNIHPDAQLAVVRMLLRAHELSIPQQHEHRYLYPKCNIVFCSCHKTSLAWHRWRDAHMAIRDYMEAGIG